MDIQYQPTLADLLAFNRYHMNHSPSLRRYHWYVRIGTSILCVVVCLITFYALTRSFQIPVVFYAIAFGLGIFFFFALPSMIWSSTKKRIERMFREGQNKGMSNTTKLAISEDGMEANNSLSASKMLWSAIEKITVTDEYIFLYVSAMNAMVIPQRAFATEAQRQEFIQLVQHYHHTANTA
jgi:hypothetical protein